MTIPNVKLSVIDAMNRLVFVHHFGTKSGRQVTLSQSVQRISVPGAIAVILIGFLHFGQSNSYSFDSLTLSWCPSETMVGGFAIPSLNVVFS